MLTLSEFLFDLEFDYKINDNNTISLIDTLQANLGNIEDEEFEIYEGLPEALVDKLDTYIYDYHISGVEDTLIHQCQYKNDIYPYDEKLIPAMKKYPNVFDNDLINYISDTIHANIDTSELTKGNKRNEQ
nr:MAG TPA: hypothetical protein [Caudoviricetes sp.]